MVLGLTVAGFGAGYADVTAEQNQEAIEVLQAVGIMTGDGNGSFNPDANITRNEMAVIMSNLMDYRAATYRGTSPFSDVPDWAEPYVAACCTNGITSGIGGNLYGGDQEVTTAQAALMMLKALGYFQYQNGFGADWMLSTVSKANSIDLLEDVKSTARDPMTRNDVAQLVLNTLESGTVEADTSNQVNVSVGGEMVSVGGTKYIFIASSEKYAAAVNSDTASSETAGQYSGKSIVELGEKLYQGDLVKKEEVDEFGRPSDNWVYKTKEIGKYAHEADYSWTKKVTAKTLYDAIGYTATTDDYKWTVSVDGAPFVSENYSAGKAIYDNHNDTGKEFTYWIDGKTKETGNGTVTEVFVDSVKGRESVHIAIMNRYAAKVRSVDKEDGTITLSDLSQTGKAAAKDEFKATGFEVDEIVIYTWSESEEKIQEVYAATLLEGKVTRVKFAESNGSKNATGDNLSVDGKNYSYNKTMKTADKLVGENVGNGLVAYLDATGYVAYIDQDAVTYKYAYVLDIGIDEKWEKDPTTYAHLVLTDGTMLEVITDNTVAEVQSMDNHIVAYTKDSNGLYTLKHTYDINVEGAKARETTDKDWIKVEQGKASFRAGKDNYYAANDKTIFVIADAGNTGKIKDYTFSVYTGISNVPDIDGKSASLVAVTTGGVANKGSNVAKVVYVENVNASGSEVIFIRGGSGDKIVKDTTLGNYYEVAAWVDSEKVILKVKGDLQGLHRSGRG